MERNRGDSPPKRKLSPVEGPSDADCKRSKTSQTIDLTEDTVATVPLTTQPTQILDTPIARRTDPHSVVQVPASSPIANPSPFTSPAIPVAPPGTSFRPPPRVSASKQPDYDSPVQDSSEDERPVTKVQNKPSLAQPKPAGLSSFQAIMNQYQYNDGKPLSNSPTKSAPPKRPSTNYGKSGMVLTDIKDVVVQNKVRRMRTVTPNLSVHICLNILMDHRGVYNDAVNYAVDLQDEGLPRPPSRNRPLQRETIDLTSSDSEEMAPKASTIVKDTKASKSLNDRWGVQAPTPTAPSAIPAKRSAPEEEDASPVKPRRRLVQGKRLAPRSPSPVEAVEVPKPNPQKRRKVVVDESDEEAEAEDADSEESEQEEEEDTSETDAAILEWINTCEARDLADTSNQTLEVAEGVLAFRPFASLDAFRAVDLHPPTKKRGTRKPDGEKMMKVVQEMWTGYEAIDDLVFECTAKGASVADEMKKWGFDVFGASKEVEITDLKHDSGIGTPDSSYDEFLKQPAGMCKSLDMKDYQIVGLNWLNLIWSQRMSGILADDMGLGKTCQVIAFLTHLYESGNTGPHLIIVPGSTLENWLQEIKKFSPVLSTRTQPYYGTMAERAEIRKKYHANPDQVSIIVTTYTTAVSKADDISFLCKLNAGVCVIDEAHYLRNPHSKRYKALIGIPAEMRLLLTGTPLQNNLKELVSLLTFLMPELFEEHQHQLQYIFKNKAKTYDDDHAALLSARRIEKARSMMTPFVLRRKKHQVLKSMPPKVCRVERCKLRPKQRKIYVDYLEQQKAVFAARAAGKRTTDNANVMMKLRQAAIHPLLHRRIYDDKQIEKLAKLYMRTREHEHQSTYEQVLEDLSLRDDLGVHEACLMEKGLYKHRLKNDEWMDSGKVEKLKELLLRFQENGDRALIFSQFTRVLDILEHVLTTLDIKALRLDGSTPIPERQPLINKFNQDETYPVFLLSTRSGGTGINLASANKVIIFDSSFNPQDDIQAENRAHRVGQTREVEVFRLVTEGTIEEQIHALGETKLALDARVAGEMAANGDEDATIDRTGKTFLGTDRRGLAMVEEMMQVDDGDAQMDDAPIDEGNEGALESPPSTTEEQQDSLKADFKDGLRNAGLAVESQ